MKLIFFYKYIQYSYKNFFVDSLRILKTLGQQWTPTRRYQFTKSTWLTYVLHSRHGQIHGTHFLILRLKMSTDLEDLMFSGINTQIFAQR